VADPNTSAPAGAPSPAPATEPAAQPVAAAPAPAAEPAKAEPAKPRAWAPKAKPVPAVQAAAAPAATEPAKPKGVAGIGSRKIAALESKVASAAKDIEEAKALREELGHYAKRELAAAPESARKYVLSKHKDDPRAQLAELRALSEAGLLTAPAAPPAPASTTVASNSPKPSTTNDEDVVVAQAWLEASKKTPMRAASLRLTNGAAIERGLQKLRAS